MPRWERAFYFLLILLSIGVGIVELYLFRNYMVDDAFISLRYVRNALEGHGVIYNIGERVEGFTSPLYILLNYILGRMGVDLVIASKVLGVAAYALILICICAWGLSNSPRKMEAPEASIVISLVATSFPLTFFAITGMETVLFSLLTLIVFLDAIKLRITLRLVIFIFIAFLCRPEGITFLIWVTLGIILVRRSEFHPTPCNSKTFLFLEKREIFYIVVFILLVLIFVIVRWQYYSEIFPNTFFAKTPWTMESVGVHWTLKGMGSIIYFFSATGGLLGILIFLSAFFKKSSSYPALMMCAMIIAAMTFFQKYAGSDWMIGSRYFIPALPVWAMGLGIAISCLNIFGNIKFSYYRVFTMCILILSIWMMNISEAKQFIRNKNVYPNNVQTSIGLKKIGVWIHDNLPANFRIRNWRIGAISYYCENPILDTWGLVDRAIGRLRFHSSSEEEGNKLVQAFINKKNPEVIITKLEPDKTEGEKDYCLFYEGKNGDETLGVWVRKDLTPNLRISPLKPCTN